VNYIFGFICLLGVLALFVCLVFWLYLFAWYFGFICLLGVLASFV
jgi:hypothetical protein